MVEVAKVLIFIGEGQAVEVVDFLKGFIALNLSVNAAENAGNIRPVFPLFESRQEIRHHDFPFALEDVVDIRAVKKDLAGRIGDFGTADEDLRFGEDAFD